MEDDKNINNNENLTIQDGLEIKPVEHTMEDYFLKYSSTISF